MTKQERAALGQRLRQRRNCLGLTRELHLAEKVLQLFLLRGD